MLSLEQVCYRYDGEFMGFLTCVFESYVHKEPPAAFLTFGDPGATLWPEREVETDEPHAMRVYKALGEKGGALLRHRLERAFLTCLPDRELILYGLIRRVFDGEGKRVVSDLSDPAMARVTLALQKLFTEEDHLRGFVRFSEVDGMLVGEIEPKNRVLPLIGPHFAARFNGEKIALYDRTHKEAFFYEGLQWRILPVEEFRIGAPGEEERAWRGLWRRFYKTIAIEGRENPKCQATHMPKRYRHVMTEFMEDEISDPLPAKLP